ncbi:CLUMA_CG011324, isoform B, partial [Clunio marinus]
MYRTYDVEDEDICSKCDCDVMTKTIDCSTRNLNQMFTMQQWRSLNETNNIYEILLLDNNFLEEIDAPFPVLSSQLKIIDLSHNQIKSIGKNSFGNLVHLEELDLSFNILTKNNLDGEIFSCESSTIKRLRLSYNLLTDIVPEIFKCIKNLEELYLDNNPFMVVQHDAFSAFTYLQELRRLDLSRMNLSFLPQTIFNATRKLEVLKLDGNEFKIIPKALKFAENLQELSLNANPLVDLSEENAMPMLPKLEKLSLSYIETLKSIGYQSLNGLLSLKEIRITNNIRLSYIHRNAFASIDTNNPSIKRWPLVEKVFLNDNKLSMIEYDLFINWMDIKELHIENNPWICDCRMKWVVDDLIPVLVKTTPNSLNDVLCIEPAFLFNQKLLDLHEEKTSLTCFHHFVDYNHRNINQTYDADYEQTSINTLYEFQTRHYDFILAALLIAVLLCMTITYIAVLICNRL